MTIKQNLLFYGLIAFLVASGIGLGVYFGVFFERDDGNGEIDDTVVLTIQGQTTTKNYTLSELKSISNVSGYAGHRKSTGTLVGPNLYKGVEINTLLADVGGIDPDEELEVIADDGYKVTFTSEMLNGYFPAYDGETGLYLGIKKFYVILAYETNGTYDFEGEGVLRIACIAEGGENYFTDGSPWVKDVTNLNIIVSNSWIVYLFGITNDSVNKPAFEAFMHINDSEDRLVYHMLEGDRTNTYEGIALWRIISIIDGELESSLIPTFNDSLAVSGYDVILKNANEEEIILRSEDIARNDSFILAAKMNAVFLRGSEAPLRLVGPSLTTFQMISGIIRKKSFYNFFIHCAI